MKMTQSEDYLEKLEEMLQTFSTQRSDLADSRKELAVFKNLKIIDKGFKAALEEGDYYKISVLTIRSTYMTFFV